MDGTLVFAVAACVLACLSLGWQVASWIYEGPRVRVENRFGFRVSSLPAEPVDMIFVTARNVGRSPVQVRWWGFMDDQNRVLDLGDGLWDGLRPPFTLDARHSTTWGVPRLPLVRALSEQPSSTHARLRGYADLGSGKRAVARRRLDPFPTSHSLPTVTE